MPALPFRFTPLLVATKRNAWLLLLLSLGTNVALLGFLILRPSATRRDSSGTNIAAPASASASRLAQKRVAKFRPSSISASPVHLPATVQTSPPPTAALDVEIAIDSAETSAAIDQRPQLENLPLEKTDQLQRIASDYRELSEQVYARTDGIIPPEEREKLVVLEQEKTADLARLLTPPELEEYQLRTSDTDRLKRR